MMATSVLVFYLASILWQHKAKLLLRFNADGTFFQSSQATEDASKPAAKGGIGKSYAE